MGREKGVVKWFSDRKGYGFIEREKGDDVFVHFDDIAGEGYRSLAEGEEVEFEVVQDPKGLRAEDVHRLGGAPADNVVQARGRVRTLSDSRRQFSAERRRLAEMLQDDEEGGEEGTEGEPRPDDLDEDETGDDRA